jgi:YidC/Oxa1 family membrane protein insertase
MCPAVPLPGGRRHCPRKITVSTDVLRLTFDGEGGGSSTPNCSSTGLRGQGKPFVLFDDSANRVYLAQTGLIGGNFPTHKTTMS